MIIDTRILLEKEMIEEKSLNYYTHWSSDHA